MELATFFPESGDPILVPRRGHKVPREGCTYAKAAVLDTLKEGGSSSSEGEVLEPPKKRHKTEAPRFKFKTFSPRPVYLLIAEQRFRTTQLSKKKN